MWQIKANSLWGVWNWPDFLKYTPDINWNCEWTALPPESRSVKLLKMKKTSNRRSYNTWSGATTGQDALSNTLYMQDRTIQQLFDPVKPEEAVMSQRFCRAKNYRISDTIKSTVSTHCSFELNHAPNRLMECVLSVSVTWRLTLIKWHLMIKQSLAKGWCC